MALSLITNRTEAETVRLLALRKKINTGGWGSLTGAEQTEWTAGRGAYNTTDLNRVGEAVIYLRDLMASYGYYVPVSPVTTWEHGDETTAPDEFKTTQAAVCLGNIHAMKAAYYGKTPLPEDMNNLTPDAANRIELLLLEIEDKLRRTAADFKYCGTFYAGEEWIT